MPINTSTAPTFLVGYDETTIVGGSATTKITSWDATTGVAAEQIVSNGGSPMPLKRSLGGTNLSFGVINPNQVANGIKSAGTQINGGKMMVAGVVDFCHGQNPADDAQTIWALGFDRLYMQRESIAAGYRLKVVGDLGTLTATEVPTASKLAYVLITDSAANTTTLMLSTGNIYTTTAISNSYTGGEAAFLALNQPLGGGSRAYGSQRILYFWNNTAQNQNQTTGGAVLSALMTAYGIPAIANVRTLIVGIGDSYMSGQDMYGGESLMQLVATSNPTARVVNISKGGVLTAEVLSTLAPMVDDATVTLGRTYANLIVIVQAGTNNVLNGTSTGTNYQSIVTLIKGMTAVSPRITVLLSDIAPVSNKSGVDATVKGYETNRTAEKARLAACTGCTYVNWAYASGSPFIVPSNDGTDAGVANAVRTVTQSSLYTIAAESGNSGSDWTMVGSDEIHFRDPWTDIIGPAINTRISNVIFRNGTRSTVLEAAELLLL